MLQQSSQFAPFSQWTCRISALQCNSLGNAFPASADSSMGLIRQLQHSFGGTAIRAQLRHSGSLLAPPAPEKCSRVAQSPLLPRAGEVTFDIYLISGYLWRRGLLEILDDNTGTALWWGNRWSQKGI